MNKKKQIYMTRYEEDSRISRSIDTILSSKHVGKRKKALLRKEKELSESELLAYKPEETKEELEGPDFEKQLENEAREEIIVDAKTKIIERVFEKKFENAKFKSVFESEQYKEWSASKDPKKDFGETGKIYVDPRAFGKKIRGSDKYKDRTVVAIPPSSVVPFKLPAPPAVHDTSKYVMQILAPGEKREIIFHGPPSRPLPQNKRHKKLRPYEKELLQQELQEISRRTRPTLHLNYWITQLKLLKTKHRQEVVGHLIGLQKGRRKARAEKRHKEALRVSPPTDTTPEAATKS